MIMSRVRSKDADSDLAVHRILCRARERKSEKSWKS